MNKQHSIFRNIDNAENVSSEVQRCLTQGHLTKASAILNARGEYLELHKHWDEALTVYKRSLEIMPDQPAVLIRTGYIYEINHDLQTAFDYYQRASVADPSDASPHIRMALVLSTSGNKVAAVDAFRESLRLRPRDPEAEHGLCGAYVDMERLEDAEPYCLHVLEAYPKSEAAHYNYGRVLQNRNHPSEAISCYQKAIELNPRYPRPYYYMGVIHQEMDNYKLALNSYKKVIDIRPDMAPAHYGMGLMYQLLRQLDQAIESYQRVIDLKDIYNDKELLAKAYVQLGYVYNRLLDRRLDAIPYFRLALQIDPEHAVAQHYLAAVGGATAPARASDRFVAQLFDEMADGFDRALVEHLGYRTPELIYSAIRNLLPGNPAKLDILDLGCGTGLCGPLFRGLSGILVGVDLSPGMIARAREKGVYDELICGELTQTLPEMNRQFDVILSADVFVYIGDLTGIFSSCRNLLTPGGLFAFSIEVAGEGDIGYVLLNSGRYAHTTGYIDKMCATFDMEQLFSSHAVIRMENDQPVNGYIYVFRNLAE